MEFGIKSAREENTILGVSCCAKLSSYYKKMGFGDVMFISLKGEEMEDNQLYKIPLRID